MHNIGRNQNIVNAIIQNSTKDLMKLRLTRDELLFPIYNNKTVLELAFSSGNFETFQYIFTRLFAERRSTVQAILKKLDFSEGKNNVFAFLYQISKHGYLSNIAKNHLSKDTKSRVVLDSILTSLLKNDNYTIGFIIKNYYKDKEQFLQHLTQTYRDTSLNSIKTQLTSKYADILKPDINNDYSSLSAVKAYRQNHAVSHKAAIGFKYPILNSVDKYNQVQCIGFSLPTSSDDYYKGLKQDSEDWKSRVKVMEQAIENSYQSQMLNNNSDCLKIFMAPEFFFRGTKGAYNMDTTSNITESLRKLVKSPKFKDWLFVFGTTVAYSECEKNKDSYEVYNFSFVQKGNGGEKESLVVMKEDKSWIDFINKFMFYSSSDILLTDNTYHLSPCRVRELRNEHKEFNYDNNAVFDIDGIRFGLEICLDNLNNRISSTRITPPKSIDINLVPSCGVGYPQISNQLTDNGITFVVDGLDRGFSRVLTKNGTNIKSLQTQLFPNCRNNTNSTSSSTYNDVFNYGGTINLFSPVRISKNKIHEVTPTTIPFSCAARMEI